MGEITGGELLVRSLHAEGVRDVWAIPDGTYMIFLEALERLGGELGMRLLVPDHEAGAPPAPAAPARGDGGPAPGGPGAGGFGGPRGPADAARGSGQRGGLE